MYALGWPMSALYSLYTFFFCAFTHWKKMTVYSLSTTKWNLWKKDFLLLLTLLSFKKRIQWPFFPRIYIFFICSSDRSKPSKILLLHSFLPNTFLFPSKGQILCSTWVAKGLIHAQSNFNLSSVFVLGLGLTCLKFHS